MSYNIFKCPKCKSMCINTEKRPDGNSVCTKCDHEDKTAKFVQTMINNEELKPCPFCGSPDTVKIVTQWGTHVECARCGSRGPCCAAGEDYYEKWNTRK